MCGKRRPRSNVSSSAGSAGAGGVPAAGGAGVMVAAARVLAELTLVVMVEVISSPR